jgi:predicted dehydrogenase
MANSVRWGVLSTAAIGLKKVIPGMQRGQYSTVNAIASRDLATAQKAATALGIPTAYGSYEQLLADPNIDAIYNPLPNQLHVPWTIRAAQAGKHVLCEKPLARTSAGAREILQVAENSPGFLMPAMCMRFWPGWSWLKQVVAEQTYGKILAARFRRMSAMPAWGAQGTYTGGGDLGGALFDLHIHDTDFVNFLFGRPEKVYATGVTSTAGAIHHVVTQYHYPNGPAVHAEGSWLLASGFNMAYTLLCERATLDFDLARGAEALIVSEAGQPPRGVKLEITDGYAGEINYILDCVANRRAPRLVTARDGVTALEICEAEEISLRTGAVTAL